MSEDDLNRAIALNKSGKKIEAREILKKIVQDDPKNDRAWMWLADTFPDNPNRIIVLEGWLKNNPDNQNAQKTLATLKAKEANKKKTSNVWIFGVILGILFAIFLFTQCTGVGGGGGENSSKSAEYKVLGDGTADLTYENKSGGTEQITVNLPWSLNINPVVRGQYLYISAQINGTGNVSCYILIDGITFKSSKSSGEYVIATCDGLVP
jgi:hypothetical protein